MAARKDAETAEARRKRLAAELRANLARRKAQARARRTDGAEARERRADASGKHEPD